MKILKFDDISISYGMTSHPVHFLIFVATLFPHLGVGDLYSRTCMYKYVGDGPSSNCTYEYRCQAHKNTVKSVS
jgi:hypothetical protein